MYLKNILSKSMNRFYLDCFGVNKKFGRLILLNHFLKKAVAIKYPFMREYETFSVK